MFLDFCLHPCPVWMFVTFRVFTFTTFFSVDSILSLALDISLIFVLSPTVPSSLTNSILLFRYIYLWIFILHLFTCDWRAWRASSWLLTVNDIYYPKYCSRIPHRDINRDDIISRFNFDRSFRLILSLKINRVSVYSQFRRFNIYARIWLYNALRC